MKREPKDATQDSATLGKVLQVQKELSNAVCDLRRCVEGLCAWQARPCVVCGHLVLLSDAVVVEYKSEEDRWGYGTTDDVPSAWAHKRCLLGSKHDRRGERGRERGGKTCQSNPTSAVGKP